MNTPQKPREFCKRCNKELDASKGEIAHGCLDCAGESEVLWIDRCRDERGFMRATDCLQSHEDTLRGNSVKVIEHSAYAELQQDNADMLKDLNDSIEKVVAQSEQIQALQRELEQTKFVPGEWRCAKCDLILHAKVISMKSGNIGANTNPQECSNGCGPMWKVTWKELSERQSKSAERMFEKIEALQSKNEELIRELEQLKKIHAHALSSFAQYTKEIENEAETVRQYTRDETSKVNKCYEQIESLQSKLAIAVELLEEHNELYNEEPCRLDHHGYCQSHFLEEDCLVKRTNETLTKLREGT